MSAPRTSNTLGIPSEYARPLLTSSDVLEAAFIITSVVTENRPTQISTVLTNGAPRVGPPSDVVELPHVEGKVRVPAASDKQAPHGLIPTEVVKLTMRQKRTG